MPFGLLLGGLLIGGLGAAGSLGAASTEASAQNNAAAIQQQMFNTTQANLQPYIGTGQTSVNALLQSLGLGAGGGGLGTGTYNTPFNPANLASTPGYQFTLAQGLQGVTDQATATGGVGGGNTLKALMGYGQGLASTTYQQQLQDYMAQQEQGFGQVSSLAGLGENAAAGLGNTSAAVGANVASNISNAGVANAAGITGATNNVNSLLAALAGNGGLSGLGSLFGGGASAASYIPYGG